jgi:hypothetical protein
MEWTADVARGDWIAPRLDGWGVAGSMAPRGFEAYVRVFHPVRLDRVLSREPTIELEERRATWRDITQRFGTIWHPLMQWQSIGRHLGEQFDIGDGWRPNDPEQGRLELDALAALVPPLIEATTTPADAVAGLWNGWGQLRPHEIGIFFAGGGSARARRRAEKAARVRLMDGVDHDIAVATVSGPLLSLPDREYVLLTAAVSEFADPTWPDRARIGSRRGWSLTPNLLWPEDRAWFLASEIDFDSTVIGGSRALIDSILATSALETAEIDEDASLTFDADLLNPPSD